ncbi:hypothetical protein AcV7_002136 [Taiwanofungus camphoratus]|nr:hypothetical protein AcV7_002136 [Antrodia cinnamomea]
MLPSRFVCDRFVYYLNTRCLGGWWTRPSNWKSNTAIAFAGILAITYGVWTVSAEREVRYVEPIRPIPSMMWAKQYREQKKDE